MQRIDDTGIDSEARCGFSRRRARTRSRRAECIGCVEVRGGRFQASWIDWLQRSPSERRNGRITLLRRERGREICMVQTVSAALNLTHGLREGQ